MEMNRPNTSPSFAIGNDIEMNEEDKTMGCDINDPDYQKCIQIIDKLEDLEASEILASILISIVYNYEEAREYLLNYHSDVIEEEE